MKSWIDSDTGNIWITSVGCSRRGALSTGLMRRLWGDGYRNSGGHLSLSFSAENGVGGGAGLRFQNCASSGPGAAAVVRAAVCRKSAQRPIPSGG